MKFRVTLAVALVVAGGGIAHGAGSPDFDGNGTVGFSDFLIFANAFGARQGDEKWDARIDLNGDGEIGFSDFVIFAQSFGIKVSDDDRSALVAFYHATDGPNWVNNENWLSDKPLGEWFGVETNREGRVVGLAMSYYDSQTEQWISNNVSGPIPSELGNLANLTLLDFNANELSGPIPAELGGLAKLTSLNLYGNDLSGLIPSELGGLSNLTLLWLGGNQLRGPIPPELGNLANLTSLYLQDNELSGPIPQSFLQLDGLRNFFITDNEGLCVPGTSAFAAWLGGIEGRDDTESLCNAADVAALKALYKATGGSGWTESSGWSGDGAVEAWHGVSADSLGRVVSLDMTRNGLSGRLPLSLGALTEITELRMGENSALSGRLPLSLIDLSLRTLHYSGTGLCAPANASFRDWLGTIPSHEGTGAECPPIGAWSPVWEAYLNGSSVDATYVSLLPPLFRTALQRGLYSELDAALIRLVQETPELPTSSETPEARLAATVGETFGPYEWPEPHPWAAVFPGLPAHNARRVDGTVTVDASRTEFPADASRRERHLPLGFYAPPSTLVTIEVPVSHATGELAVSVGELYDNLGEGYAAQPNWRRAPWLRREFPVTDRQTTVTNAYGGSIALIVPPYYSGIIPVTVRGAIPMAVYTAGESSAAEWLAALDRGAPQAIIQKPGGIRFVISAESARGITDPGEVSAFWDGFYLQETLIKLQIDYVDMKWYI